MEHEDCDMEVYSYGCDKNLTTLPLDAAKAPHKTVVYCDTAICLHFQTFVRALPTHLPKLLACIFASYSLQNLGSTRVLVHEASHLVYIVIDDDVQAFFETTGFLHVVDCELFRHGGWTRSWIEIVIGWIRAVCGNAQGIVSRSSIPPGIYNDSVRDCR
jgi:hypothetical protein